MMHGISRPRVLEAHGFAASIAPEHGGLLASLTWAGPSGGIHPVLHSPADAVADAGSPIRFGLWPMLPFANRAFGGIIDDGHQRIELPINDPAMASAIHGFGWQAQWQVADESPAHITLLHERAAPPGGDPYSYRATMRIALEQDHVRISLAVTNLADAVLPFGIGFHPWLPRAEDTALCFAATGQLALGRGYRAVGLDAWRNGGPFAAGQALPQDRELAVSAVDWQGEALFETRSTGLGIAIDASGTLRHPVLWTPPQADFVCFEPQSHGIGAPSEEAARAVTPLTRLSSGKSLDGWMTIRPYALAPAAP